MFCMSVYVCLLDAAGVRMGTKLLELRTALLDVHMIRTTTVQLSTLVTVVILLLEHVI